MVRRRWIAGSLLLLVGPGCHLGQQRQPAAAAARPEPLVSQVDAQAARFVAQHNRNSNLIRSMEARPGVSVNGRRLSTHMTGRMAMERDRNFLLELFAFGQAKANIGSNDQEFWFWVDDEDSSVYVCDYKDLDKCDLAATFQPDWILEAMGLRPFSEREAKTIVARPVPNSTNIILTQHRPDARGPGFTKETTVNKDGQIVSHKLYDASKKELLAEASIYSWIKTTFPDAARPAEAGDGADAAPATPPSVVIPGSFRLAWKREKITLDVTIERKGLVMNPTFDDDRRLAMFSEPKIDGAARRNLALLDPATGQASGSAANGSRVRETRPAPPPGEVRIGAPEPSGLDSNKATRRAIDPIPLGPDLGHTPAQPAGVVGAPYPTADSSITRSSLLGRRRRSAD